MPIKVSKRGKKFVVSDPGGRVYGRHKTKKAAQKQRAAINISKARHRGK